MTRIFSEGFESGDGSNFDQFAPYNGVTVTSPARISGRSANFQDGWGTWTWKNLNCGSEIYVRLAFYPNNWNGETYLFQYWDTSYNSLGSIRLSSGFIHIYTGGWVASGTYTVSPGNWHVLEARIKIDDAGIIDVKLDGMSYVSYSGDTKPGSNAVIGRFGFIAGTATWFDDIAINDVSGGADNSWCGDGHFYGVTLDGNGDSSQWVGNDGNSTDNYLLVDEIPYTGDTDYVESATSGNQDLYNTTALPALPSGSIIKRVIVEAKVREITADGDSIQIGLKSGATENWSANQALSVSYTRKAHELTTNPDTSSAWTESDIAGLQIGVKVP